MGSNPGQESGDFDLLLVETQAAVQRADEIDALWRDTEKLVARAIKFHKKNDINQALKLIKRAKKQANLAYQQALEQRNAQPWLF